MYQGCNYTAWSEGEDRSGRLLIVKPLRLGAIITRDRNVRMHLDTGQTWNANWQFGFRIHTEAKNPELGRNPNEP